MISCATRLFSPKLCIGATKINYRTVCTKDESSTKNYHKVCKPTLPIEKIIQVVNQDFIFGDIQKTVQETFHVSFQTLTKRFKPAASVSLLNANYDVQSMIEYLASFTKFANKFNGRICNCEYGSAALDCFVCDTMTEHFFTLFDTIKENHHVSNNMYGCGIYPRVENDRSKDIMQTFIDTYVCYLCELDSITEESVTIFYEKLQQNLDKIQNGNTQSAITLVKVNQDNIVRLNEGCIITLEGDNDPGMQLKKSMIGRKIIPVVHHIKH